MLESRHVPMRGDVPQTPNAGVLHGDGRIETLGDGAGDEGGALFLQQLDQPLLLRHERIDPLSLPVEEGGDGALLMRWCERKTVVLQLYGREVIDRIRVSTGH